MVTDGGDEPRGRPDVTFDPTKPKASTIARQECQSITGKLTRVDCETVRNEPLDWRDIDSSIRCSPRAKLGRLFGRQFLRRNPGSRQK